LKIARPSILRANSPTWLGGFDGYVAQSTGDGIFALFGAPVAHEDHPHRALYAALRMQEELKRYSNRIHL
jgi:class 3 adenylate cyclase